MKSLFQAIGADCCYSDVFLTTMKPNEKVVTAGDVQSSFYYIHADSEKDDELLRSEDPQAHTLEEECNGSPQRTQLPSITGSIRRKPVLPTRTSFPAEESKSSHGGSPPRLSVSALNVNGQKNIHRKPVGQPKPVTTVVANGSLAPASQRIMGPRPLHDIRPHSVDHTASSPSSVKEHFDLRRRSEQPNLPLRPYDQKQRDLEEIYAANHTEYPSRPHLNGSSSHQNQTAPSMSSATSLTLIRRYNNTQSNVGKITKSTPDDQITLELLTPSYSKLERDPNTGRGHSDLIDTTEIPQYRSSAPFFRCEMHSIASGRHGRGYWGESNGFTLKPGAGSRDSFDSRSQQSDHFGSDVSGPSSSHPVSPALKSSAKGFTFQSPWGGTCDFFTGVAGRSLKCRHVRPRPSGMSGLDPIDVSELRFNLPTSKTFGSPAPKSPQPGTARATNRLSYFSHKRQQRSSVDLGDTLDDRNTPLQMEPDEDRLDLSLGQEHAGGGFGGRQAKLGKLIVEHEGLHMLDLVVAANMALWWRVYERMVLP